MLGLTGRKLFLNYRAFELFVRAKKIVPSFQGKIRPKSFHSVSFLIRKLKELKTFKLKDTAVGYVKKSLAPKNRPPPVAARIQCPRRGKENKLFKPNLYSLQAERTAVGSEVDLS